MLTFALSNKKFSTIGQALVSLNPEITEKEVANIYCQNQKRQFIIERFQYAYHYFCKTGRGTGLAELGLLLENNETGWLRWKIGFKNCEHISKVYVLLKNQAVRDWFNGCSRDLWNGVDFAREVRNDCVHGQGRTAEDIEKAFFMFLQVAELYCRDYFKIDLFSQPIYTAERNKGDIICGRFEVVNGLGGNEMSRTYEVCDTLGHNEKSYALKWVSVYAEKYNSIIKNETTSRPLFNNNPNVGRFYSSHDDVPVGTVLLLEYIDGWVLSDWISKEKNNVLGSSELYELIYAIGGVLNALREIHSRGYVHANVTDKSIIITRNSKDAKLVSFDNCNITSRKRRYHMDTAAIGKILKDIFAKCRFETDLPESLQNFVQKATSPPGYADASLMYEGWITVYNDIRIKAKPQTRHCRIALISCSNRKRVGIMPAEELYSESPNFRDALNFAKDPKQGYDKIYITSGRYGLVDLRQVLTTYNLDLRHWDQKQRDAWATNITSVLKNQHDPIDCTLTVFADDIYSRCLFEALSASGFKVERNLNYFQVLREPNNT